MNFPNRFAGRGAIVTGGASGIGLRTVERLASEGAKVSIWDVNQNRIDAAVARLGTNVSGLAVNVADYEAVGLPSLPAIDEMLTMRP